MSPALALDGVHTLELRDYQEQAIDAVLTAEARGVRRQVVVLPTGAGKTPMFVSLAARKNVRTLILAHRDELISQAADKVRMWWPDADLGIVKAARNEVWAQDVVVASIQSLSPRRLVQLGQFGLVVGDEFHHANSTSWGKVLDHFGCGPTVRRSDGPLLLGVTATPNRADGKGLDKVADEIVFERDLLWAIRSGYLCDIRAKEVKMENLRLGDVKIRQGDYAEGDLGAAMTAANAPWWIVRAWKEHASDRKTLVFSPTVANAEDVAAEFLANGIKAAAVSGSTPIDDRRRILRDFSTGRIQVLSNCQLAVEGYDEPSIDCVVWARPTKSLGFYKQGIGRGTRLYPGKQDLLILDVVGDSSKMDLCTAASLAGLDRKAMVRRTLSEAVEDKEAAEARQAAQRATTPLLRPDADVLTRDVDLFAKRSRIAWASIHHGRAFAASAGDGQVVIAMQPDETWSVSVVKRGGETSTVLTGVPMQLAQGVAEDQVRKSGQPRAYSDKNAGWRSKPPSEKQIAAAAKWRIVVPRDENGFPLWTGGELGDALTARIAQANLAKARKTG